ncbi:unnamed protein product [Cuscuta campestris]|uniref:Late embryogenesis abundant protein LEA-2 subgroup domain-containing protein n=1 Tax=Cuscuta campestris TaxID=132261 RepID=A0A484MS44_9ASTE|nr:unnamed protein product [Cuscuta campestris]
MDPKQRKRAVCLNIIAPCAAIVLIIGFLAWLLWPTDPEFTVVDHHIRDVNKDLFPPTLTFKMDVTVKVRNKSVYTFKYDSLNMTIRHDGNLLAVVEPTSGGGAIAGKAVSLVNATLDVDMIKIIKHSPSLIADLFTHLGAIPLVMQANVTNAKFGIGIFTPSYKIYFLTPSLSLRESNSLKVGLWLVILNKEDITFIG